MELMIKDTVSLQQLEKREREKFLRDRSQAYMSSHRQKGNFIACLGRQNLPLAKNDVGFRPLSSGFYIKYDKLELLIDPGANLLYRASKGGINLFRTNTIFISHPHIDHHNDVDVALELSTLKEPLDPVRVMLSQKAITNNSVSPYHFDEEKRSKRIEIIKIGDSRVSLFEGISLLPIKSHHSIDGSYGFVLDIHGFKIGYTGDTGFSKKFKTVHGEYPVGTEDYQGEIIGAIDFDKNLKKAFGSVDVLLFNLHNFSYKSNSLYHSTAFDAIELLKGSKIALCVCDHFNPNSSIGKEYPKKVIRFIKEQSGKNVLLVKNGGLVLDLDKFLPPISRQSILC